MDSDWEGQMGFLRLSGWYIIRSIENSILFKTCLHLFPVYLPCIYRVFTVYILLYEPLFVSSHLPHSPYTAYRIALLAAAMVIYPMAGVSMECAPMACAFPSFLLQGKASTASTTRDGIGNGRSSNDGAAYGVGFRRFFVGIGPV